MSEAMSNRMPWSALLALATAAFITILTAALPAGVLPQISRDLNISESLAGQLVTLYAAGCVVATISLTNAVRRFRQRPIILTAIVGFIVVNTLTAISTSYPLTLCARFVAGAVSGLLWAQLAGQASRISPPHLRGRAISIAMLGIPAALSFGIPAGTLIGLAAGWRATFGIVSGLCLMLIVWILISVPDLPHEPEQAHPSIRAVISVPDIKAILLAMTSFVLAHNILYTYIASYIAPTGLAPRTSIVLLVFGVAALVGMFVTGALIDRYLRGVALVSISLFLVASLALAIWSSVPLVVYLGAAVWGLAFGGAPAIYQTASAHAAGKAVDVAQAIVVTVWNAAIAGAGVIAAVMLDRLGVQWFAWTLVVLLMVALATAWMARRHGFPAN
jgi:predicted MFS family arabinose efflux permease